MKHRKLFAMGAINVLLAAALVTNAQRADSDLQVKHNTIHDLNQKLEVQGERIQQQQEELLEKVKLEKENNDLKYKLNSVKNKLDSERLYFQEQLEKKDRLFAQKLETLSSNKEQAKQNEGSTYLATYYDANVASTGKGPGHPAYGITKSGRKVEAGVTIAVDPKVIPLGSWVEVMYPDGRVEKRRADDTGGLIKGRHVDIYVPDASGYGKHQVHLRVISSPERM